jgi:hypothetical protein
MVSRRQRRLSDSSIDISDYGKLFDETLHSSDEICLYDHPELKKLIDATEPRFRVYLTRLEPRVRVYSDAKLTNTVAYSRDVAECTIADGSPDRVAEAFLFDATAVGQIMCLGVGRYPHNQLRPFVGEDMDAYYENPDVLDPACICGQISRDHGLVFLSDDGKIKFRDFGTKKSGSRDGSKNGSWINGEYRMQNAVFEWPEDTYLGIGGRVWVRREGRLVKEHVFKLRYEKLR